MLDTHENLPGMTGLPNSFTSPHAFDLHRQLYKNDTCSAYRKTRMPGNSDEYSKFLLKLGYFQQT